MILEVGEVISSVVVERGQLFDIPLRVVPK